MKKRIILLLLLITISITAQNNNAVDLTIGYTPDGYAIDLNYNYLFKNSNYFKIGVYTSSMKQKKDYTIPYSISSINIGYYIPIYTTTKQNFVLAVGLGGLGGYETINKNKNELENGTVIKSKSGIIYGGFGSIEAEYSITRKIFILAKIKEDYHFNTDIGATTFYGGLGIKYYLN